MKKRNPMARLLRAAIFQPKIAPLKKGKRPYKRVKINVRSDLMSVFTGWMFGYSTGASA